MAGSPSIAELGRGFELQARIVGALVLREMRTRFGQYQFGYAWALVEPLVQIGIFSTMFYLTGARPALGNSYEVFFLTGFLPFALFRDTAVQTSQAIAANRALLSFPPIRYMDAVWARIILEVVTNLASLCFVLLIFAIVEIPVVPDDPLKCALGLLAMIVVGAGVGIFNAFISTIFKSWMIFFGWFMRLEFLGSGAFFVPERFPPYILDILKWNPPTQAIIMVREGFYSGYRSFIANESLPFVFGGIMIALGLIVEKLYRRRISKK